MSTTTKATHTPGPWHILSGKGRGYWIADSVTAQGRVSVADVHPVSTGDDHYANARLIAAAPELLEALYHIADVADSGTDAEAIIAECGRVAEAAIAKATGQS